MILKPIEIEHFMIVESKRKVRSFSEFSQTSPATTATTSNYIRPTKMSKIESESLTSKGMKVLSKLHYITTDGEEEYNHHHYTSNHYNDSESEINKCSGEESCTDDSCDTLVESTPQVEVPDSDSKLSERTNSILEQLDPKDKSNSDTCPDTYLQQLFETIMGFRPIVRPTLELSSQSCDGLDEDDRTFIPPVSEDDQTNYSIDVVSAVREDDLERLQQIHSNGRSLSCCNRFGESLLHMACRRGFDSIALYLIQQADVSIRISDDCGRTPLHDGLWHKECQYVIMDLLVRTDPLLLLTCDKHGHTPFAYCRREHWANWRQFLWDRREHMKSVMDEEEMELFRPSS